MTGTGSVRRGIAAGLAFLLGAAACSTVLYNAGLGADPVTPTALSAQLAPTYRLTTPRGEGPFPTALLFSGCDGPRDNLETWAQALAEAEWASLIVDSHSPRGLTEFERWRLVCMGQILTGEERAGDVAVALADARRMPKVDPSRLALIGASHGGWAVLEYLSSADHHDVPPTLTAWPLGAKPLDGVAAVLALYPYCGELAQAPRRGWSSDIPVMLLLAQGDTITNEQPCLRMVRQAARNGLPVETHVYSGVTHGFDQRDKAPLSTLDYFPAAAADAISRGTDFLNKAIGS
ncbi:dienelactone hydrolase family protein [Tropicimonas isoalkanivorans]|uniref:Dienelactone hydrolase n=1 Tax=Tropicimonas isoalkanivorans TaxID=441112 RepID=A0A1I1KM67_9RHOB|nr:dienelactone hydrolase family protein [Tropicimonas isoalkanivorans]SFC62064.1 Dienelactone hydrolase [Tropicimonas isoalkanivorans]